MTLQLALPPETEAKLRQRAEAVGEDLGVCAARLLDWALRRPSLEEAFAPVRQAFEDSGMTEAQLSDFLENSKHRRRGATGRESL